MTPKEQKQYIKKVLSQVDDLLRHLSVGRTPEQRDVCRYYLNTIIKDSLSTLKLSPNNNEVEYSDYSKELSEVYSGKIKVSKDKTKLIKSKIKDLKSMLTQYNDSKFRQQRDLLKEHVLIKLSSAIHNVQDSEDIIEVEMPYMGRK